MPNNWYDVKALNDGVVEINIYDEIGMWGVSASEFIGELGRNSGASDIRVNIHSPGGSLLDGVAMYTALKQHSATITTRVAGIAASAASLVFLAGDVRSMPEDTFVMIHNPWMWSEGSSEELRKAVDTLEAFEDMMINVYVRETELDYETIKEMMRQESWFNASDALSNGFATVIESPMKVAALSRDFKKNFGALPDALSGASKDKVRNISTLKDIEANLRDAGGYSREAAKDLVASTKRIIARDAKSDSSVDEALELLNTFKLGE